MSRIAPRAGIPETQIARAADAISERKSEVADNAESGDAPTLPRKSDEGNPFDDSDLIHLFMPLLRRISC